MDPNEILKHAPEVLKGGAEIIKTGAEVAGAFKLTEIMKAILGPATGEFAERIHDRVRLYRFGRQLECLKKAEKMAKDAGFTPKAVPIKILFPLLEGASLEENDNLHTMWAALLANAASPENPKQVRTGFIAVLRQMEPDEAALLNWMVSIQEPSGHASPISFREIALAYNELGLGPVDLATILGPRPIPPPLLDSKIQDFGTCLMSIASTGLVRRVDREPSDAYTDHLYYVTWRGDAFVRACRPPTPK